MVFYFMTRVYINCILKILCTLPVLTVTPEHTISSLKLIKTYLQNRISEVCNWVLIYNPIQLFIKNTYFFLFQTRFINCQVYNIYIHLDVDKVINILAKQLWKLNILS